VAGRTGDVVLAKADVGLANADNTSDAGKPVSTAQATADALRVLKAGDTMSGDLTITGAATNTPILRSYLAAGDSQNRYQLRADGTMYWGSGAVTQDTNLYRSAADTLMTDDALVVGGALTVAGTLTANGAVTGIDKTDVGLPNVDNTSDINKPVSTAQATADGLRVVKTGDTMSGALGISMNAASAMITAINPHASGGGINVRVASGRLVFVSDIAGDTQNRFSIDSDGKQLWGAGAVAADTNLYRSAADTLKTDDRLVVAGNLTTTGGFWISSLTGTASAIEVLVSGETYNRLTVDASGKMLWGTGAANAGDTNLYRSAADALKTDDSFIVGANLAVTGTSGFTGTVSFTAQPHMTGSIWSSRTSATLYALEISGPGASSTNHLSIQADGKMWWADGTNAIDTNLYRLQADYLKTDDNFQCGQYLQVTHATAPRLIMNSQSTERAYLEYDSATAVCRLDTDGTLYLSGNNGTTGGLEISTDGKLWLGELSNFTLRDTNLYRSGADTLRTDDSLSVGGTLAVGSTSTSAMSGPLAIGLNAASAGMTIINPHASGGGLNIRLASGRLVFVSDIAGDSQNRFSIDSDGKQLWGTGAATGDTNLYRSAADTLKTDDSLIVGTNLTVTGTLTMNGSVVGLPVQTVQVFTGTNPPTTPQVNIAWVDTSGV
jgi:hypothetical protein